MEEIRCIIIEDEKRSSNFLKVLLEKYTQNVVVLAEAENIKEGVAQIKAHQPNLVFLDIEMPDENGFELFKYFDELTFEVVFTTAYEQYAIKAIKLAALDYLVKPVNLEELKETLVRFRNRPQNQELKRQQHQLLKAAIQTDHQQKIALPNNEGMMFVEVQDIIRCESDKSYTQVFLKNGKQAWISKNLGEYAKLLEDFGFVRVHRSHLINTKYIQQLTRGKAPILVMNDGSKIPVALAKKDELMNYILGT